ncbi:DNA-binding protein HU-beta [Reichenbachiella faecimaris]|uniref:DNA-binding protein HU-beta n=1 Tax=Reichenbachiella faecimaris TaxID=692418 RepID=A0A1W2GFM3_REIFA|nr:DNA-binding protein HU-beta [Reichenbachiella faecimaris]
MIFCVYLPSEIAEFQATKLLCNLFILLFIPKKLEVTKADVINEIAEKTGIDRLDVQASVEAFFSVVKNSMADGENIYVRGFGSFINKKRAKKIARNISKNTAIIIDEHYIPSFKPSKVFIEKIKGSKKIG